MVRVPILSSYSKITLTGFIGNWENSTIYPFYATNELHTDLVTQSSVEFIKLTVLNFTTTNTFFYAHSNIQSSIYQKFKFICIDSHLVMNTRFLSVSNRAINFELTNNIIEDLGDVVNPSIVRGDGLTTDINIISIKSNFISEITDITIKFINRLKEF